jgi:hypothetical protein
MEASQYKVKTTRIIACGVFKPALEYLRIVRRYPNLRVTYLPPVLHTRPDKLKKQLNSRATSAKRRDERIICLYGDCFPDIHDYCEHQGIIKVPGCHCYEMLLGTERFNKIIDETTGTYFLEKELIVNFKDYCMEPLELFDEEMRKFCFDHYRKLLYVRQPGDPDLVFEVSELANFLDLSLAVSDADYSHLERMLDIIVK